MDKLGFIVQARLGSTRLPNKMKMPFYENISIPEIIISKIKERFPKADIILATTINEKDNYFDRLTRNLGIKIFRGSEENVLKRFIDAAEFNNIKKIIRICADNPFLDINELDVLISSIDDSEYISFKVNGKPSILTHFGFWAEYITLDALRKIEVSTNESHFKEHVTNYVYSNPDKFKIKFINPMDEVIGRENIRMTIDTSDDFKNLAFIYKQLKARYPDNFGIKEIINFLDENPEMLNLMSQQIEQNSK
ncbi:cytidylyltransferase domain-containing protein [Epilithonimonas hominis]|uniref:cytidylyltransferase domain-containing protein n=1 Tax=Epilithonimonas hominis TaxID=420404 RepID=UPI00289C445A|nr:hypothetical protein [Epilithonimonas hominis]